MMRERAKGEDEAWRHMREEYLGLACYRARKVLVFDHADKCRTGRGILPRANSAA